MQTSVRYGVQYPSADRSDTADVPRDFIAVVAGLENSARYGQGTLGLRPTSSGGSPGIQGRFYMATDLSPHVLYYDYGTGWDTVGSVTAGSVRGSDNADAQREILQGSVRRIDLSTQLKPSGAAVDADEALRALGTAAGNAAPGATLAALLRQGAAQELTHRVVNALGILEPGIAAQLRAGRVLAATDFTTLLGLSAPIGLYNLSDATDASGNARNLSNRNAVAFGTGITGAATEAAIFTGGDKALYLADAGAGDPFRIGYGSWGCWFRCAKPGSTQQILVSKWRPATSTGWMLDIVSGSVLDAQVSSSGTGTTGQITGTTNVCDDRWHYAVATYDGSLLTLYLDGQLEAQPVAATGPIFGSVAPFNIGSYNADAGTAAGLPFFGRVDEAFVTPDVLSLDQVRALYAAKVAHGLAVTPNRAQVNVRRRKRGGALTAAPFSTQPLHLYDFTAGSLADAGSLGNALANNGAALAAPGADGALGNAFRLDGATQYFSATDAGLPAAAAARSYGCWFKALTQGANGFIMAYGTNVGGQRCTLVMNTNGQIMADDATNQLVSSASYNDGQWHFAVVVEDNAAAEGLKTKLYIDGRLVASSPTFIAATTTLGGANAFRIGQNVGGANPFAGQIDGVFITNYAATADEVAKLFAQGTLTMPASPKNEGDHVEAIDATNVYLICDTLDSQHQIDVLVAA